MRPVDQTIIGNGRNGSPRGNCFAACLASILEVPLEEVPHWPDGDETTEDEDFAVYWRQLQEWCMLRGWVLLEISPGEDGAAWERLRAGFGYHVVTGQSYNYPETYHSVVGLGLCIVHDPHPTRKGVASEGWFCLVVPLDSVGALSGML